MTRRTSAAKYRKLAILVAVIIGYGSLYPFHFTNGWTLSDALLLLSESWRTRADAYDFLVNVVFYMPLGFCLYRGLTLRPLARLLATFSLSCALCSTLELIQAYEGDRTSSVWDILANCAGSMFGIALSEVLRRGTKWLVLGRLIARPFIALLLTSGVGWILLQPTANYGNRWLTPAACAALYSQIAAVLAFALLLQEVVDRRFGRFAPLPVIAAVLMAGSLIGKSMRSSMLASAAIALVLWSALLWKGSGRRLAMCLFCASGVVLERLQPWHFIRSAHPFQWIPFLGFILAPPEACLPMVMQDTFSLGILMWLLMRAGIPRLPALLAGTAVIALVLVARCFIPGKPSEIADLISLLGLAAMMIVTGEEEILLSQSGDNKLLPV